MNGITNYILLITLLIYGSRAPAQNVKQENDSVKMNKPFNMDVRTNIIYDALLISNVGVEFDLGKRWTVAANAMYGWWNNDRSHWYWRAYGGDVALRKWLGKAARRKALTGHHVGVYGQIFTYDFETGGRGLHGRQAWWYALGQDELRGGSRIWLLPPHRPKMEHRFHHRSRILGRNLPRISPTGR